MYKLLLIIIFIVSSISMASDKILLNSFVDKASSSTDETIKLTITLKHSSNINLKIPDIGYLIQGLKVVDFGEEKPETIEKTTLKERWFILEAFLSGTYKIPAVTINHQNSTFKTSPIFVEFKNDNTKKNNETDIRDIKDIYLIPVNFLLWISILASFLFIVIGGYFLYRFISKKKKEIPPKPAHLIALEELVIIKNIKFDNKQNAKQFSFKLSELIRAYIENIFNINVTDKTTNEIKQLSSLGNLNQQLQKSFLTVLDDTDLVKFTDFIPAEEKRLELINLTTIIINKTMPQENIEQEENIL